MDVFLALCSALGGGVLSSVVTILVTAFANRRKNRLDEASIISNISAQLREELFEKYEEQKATTSLLRKVIINLTGLLDEVFPRIEGITQDERLRLKNANLEARLAGLEAGA